MELLINLLSFAPRCTQMQQRSTQPAIANAVKHRAGNYSRSRTAYVPRRLLAWAHMQIVSYVTHFVQRAKPTAAGCGELVS